MSKFSKEHHNAIANDIRKEFLRCLNDFPERNDKLKRFYGIDALVKLALRLAKRFKEDNERFDPLHFLDACSPDPETHPLSELWEVEN